MRLLFHKLIFLCIGLLVTVNVSAKWDETNGLPPDYIIGHLAWNPDGSEVIAGYFGGYVRRIDLENNQFLAKFDLDEWSVSAVAWSPNGKLVAGASYDGPVRIWDVVNRKSFQSFTVRLHPLALNWSADSKQLLVGAAEENTLSVWDVESSKIIKERDDSGSVVQIVWSPDGKTLGIANPVGRVVLTDGKTFERIRYFETPEGETHGADIYRVSWYPDNHWIASGGLNGMVRIWNTDDGSIVREWRGNDYPGFDTWESSIRGLQFSPSGKYLTAVSANGTIRTWDVDANTLQAERKLEAHVTAAAWSWPGIRLAYAENVPLANPDQPLERNLHVIIPVAAPEELVALTKKCVSDAVLQKKLLQEQNGPLSLFIEDVKQQPEGAISAGCKGDLLALAAALPPR
jgi:WD40 repeat protein